MPERIHVEYTRKLSTHSNDEYNTQSYGAGWDFDIPEGGDFQSEYERGLAVVRLTVDQLFDGVRNLPRVEQPAQPVATPAAAMPGESFARQPQRPTPEKKESNGAIIEGIDYEFSGARVWNVELSRTQRGKQFIKVRIGSKEQIPGGYATVKSYNPVMINKLSAFQEGDHMDIRGQYEGWDGNNGRMYDFVPVEVDKVRDVRRD